MAAQGFGLAADAYERGRPGYPHEAVAFLVATLGIGPGRAVVDLAAGTGKLTRQLMPTGADVIAVEPVPAMRAALVASEPPIRALDGTAEAMPLPDRSADAIVAAQAFHWFDGDRAVAEIHRVLRAGRRLGIVFNVRDERPGWTAELPKIFEPYRGDTPTHRTGAWRDAFSRTDRFTPLQRRRFRHEQRMNVDTVVERVMSISFIAALPDDERARVGERVRALLADVPGISRDQEIVLPYRTDVWWCDRI